MKKYVLTLFVFLSAACCFSKETSITLEWPQDKPVLRLTFEKFHQIGNYLGQNSFLSDVTVVNLTDKLIPRAQFTVYLSDKNNVRIGDSVLQVSEIGPGQTVRVSFQFSAVGIPASLALSAKKDMLAGKVVPIKVVSVPAGASVKVDGVDAGIAPVLARLTVGSHRLDLSKEGYAPGTTTLDIAPDELPGGSITVELGGLGHDVVELRNGSSLSGDVLSMSMTTVTVRVDGKDQDIDRNQIKKIMLVERIVTQESAQPVPNH